ncbi:Proline iminopeptidase [Apiospora aurea]|uniref:Proline iminopeptidase n=1 Tax=Apiospora aurea TaxID=335848 RepID=A0ABR1QDI3_9PEZI
MDYVAKLVSKSQPFLVPANVRQNPGKILVTELWFEVPLDYSNPGSRKLKLFARSAARYERPIVEPAADDKSRQKPYLVYLQGGPGYGNPTPQDSPLSSYMLDRGYELLLLDYRGVGLSSTVSAETLPLIGGPQEQADYLKQFRADNIVRDCEAIRKYLTKDYPAEKKKWSIFGQSFGGMTSLTYLSFRPEGLRESFITGGLAALDKGPEEVYPLTYKKVIERNQAYYKKFPGDVAAVKEVANKILELGATREFLSPGGGPPDNLDQFGIFTRATLNSFEQDQGWDNAPIYAMLHEPCWIYGPGIAANWAAERVGKTLSRYQWLNKDWAGPQSLKEDEPMYFSGEMVYSFYFDVCGGLKPLKETAQILAEFDKWPPLYDIDQLQKNEVPVYAACYEDMYVDPGTARVTASKIKGIKVFETNVLYHSALRGRSEDVFRELLRLRDDTID